MTGTSENVQALAAAGADLDVEDEKHFTPLRLAIYKDNAAAAEALLELGADCRKRDSQGQDAAFEARQPGRDHFLPLLRKHGCAGSDEL